MTDQKYDQWVDQCKVEFAEKYPDWIDTDNPNDPFHKLEFCDNGQVFLRGSTIMWPANTVTPYKES